MTRSRARAAAWITFALGLSLGALGDRSVPRVPPMRGGYLALAGDFHVHSFPGDGALAPWDIAHEARRRRLNVFALTNHNATYSWRLARALGLTSETPDVLILPGDEVTAVGFHVAAVGIERPVSWRGSIEDVAAAIHAQGGVAIGAHPAGEQRRTFDAAAFRALDGIEAAHPGMFETERLRLEYAEVYRAAVAAHPTIAAIGSTDFHSWAPLGLCRTYLFVRRATRDGVLDAIRAGRTVACDARGDVHGPATLAALVKDDCRADMTTPPMGDGLSSRAGTTIVWFSLVALVILGADP